MLPDQLSTHRAALAWPRRVVRLARVSMPGWLSLSVLGALFLGICVIGLLLPYNLFALKLRPYANIANLTAGNRLAQAGFVLTLAALAGVYYLAWRACRAAGREGRPSRAVWAALLGSLLAINLAMLWLYPIDAADVFDNIDRGRITAQYGGNPFYDTPRRFAHDWSFGYVAWPDYTSAYGPLWELMAAGTSRLAGSGTLANVLAFKTLDLLFYAGCVAIIAGILRRQAPERALQGVCLFALNPIVIYETAGNGHNDIVMVFFILLGLWALLRGRPGWAALALVAGGLIKFIPLLLLPVVAATAWRALPGWRRRLRWSLFTGLAAAVMVAAAFAPFWRGGDILAVQRRATLFTASFPALAQAQLEASLGVPTSERTVAAVAALLTLVVAGYQAWRAWRGDDWMAPIRASTHILLFYLLFACLWFQAWYTLWPLALAALLPEGAVARTVVLLSYAAAWKTIIFDDFVYTGGPLPSKAWRETLLGPITLGIPWLYVAYRSVRQRRRHAAERRASLPAGPA